MFADFTVGLIGNKTGLLFKCLKLYRNNINTYVNESQNMLRRNIAATWLKIQCKKLIQ